MPRRLVIDGIHTTSSLPSPYYVDPVWGVFALQLRGTLREAALLRVFGNSADAVLSRTLLLKQAQNVWHGSIGVAELDLLRRALANLSLHDCYRVTAEALPILHEAGGHAVINDCLEAVGVVSRWWRPREQQAAPAAAEPFTVSNVVSGHVTGNVVMVGQVERIIMSTEDTDETDPR